MKIPFAAFILATTMVMSPLALTMEPSVGPEQEESYGDPYFGWLFPLFMWLHFGIDWPESPLHQ